MAKEKNSFIVYYDFEEQTATLSDQQVGRLIRVMLDYEKQQVQPQRRQACPVGGIGGEGGAVPPVGAGRAF